MKTFLALLLFLGFALSAEAQSLPFVLNELERFQGQSSQDYAMGNSQFGSAVSYSMDIHLVVTIPSNLPAGSTLSFTYSGDGKSGTPSLTVAAGQTVYDLGVIDTFSDPYYYSGPGGPPVTQGPNFCPNQTFTASCTTPGYNGSVTVPTNFTIAIVTDPNAPNLNPSTESVSLTVLGGTYSGTWTVNVANLSNITHTVTLTIGGKNMGTQSAPGNATTGQTLTWTADITSLGGQAWALTDDTGNPIAEGNLPIEVTSNQVYGPYKDGYGPTPTPSPSPTVTPTPSPTPPSALPTPYPTATPGPGGCGSTGPIAPQPNPTPVAPPTLPVQTPIPPTVVNGGANPTTNLDFYNDVKSAIQDATATIPQAQPLVTPDAGNYGVDEANKAMGAPADAGTPQPLLDAQTKYNSTLTDTSSIASTLQNLIPTQPLNLPSGFGMSYQIPIDFDGVAINGTSSLPAVHKIVDFSSIKPGIIWLRNFELLFMTIYFWIRYVKLVRSASADAGNS